MDRVAEAPGSDSGEHRRAGELAREYLTRWLGGTAPAPETFIAEHPAEAETLRRELGELGLLDSVRGRVDTSAFLAADPEVLPEIEGYEVLDELGRGGMGVVYRAVQLATHRQVALKVLLAGRFSSPAARRRFARETELAARLRHPSIAQVLSAGETAGQPYYVMEYIVGERLSAYLGRTKPGVRGVVELFAVICKAVEAAHGEGVIHRDLKPGNVLVDESGAPHIVDFGLAKPAFETEGWSDLSSTGEIVGTLAYLSPEQARGDSRAVDGRTDVYALGVMLYEALTGRVPFAVHDSPSSAIRRVLHDVPPAPSDLARHVDRELEAVVLTAMARDPERRYQSAAELRGDLVRYLAGEPVAARPHRDLMRLRLWLARHRRVAAAVALLVLAVVITELTSMTLQQRRNDQARHSVLTFQRALEHRGDAMASSGVYAIHSRHPELQEAGLLLAQVLYRTPETRDAAVQVVEEEIAGGRAPWAARLLRADMARREGDLQIAARLQAEGERGAPDTSEGWYVRSFATLDRSTAVAAADTAVLRDPENRLAWERLAGLRVEVGDSSGALAAADRLIALGEPTVVWMVFKGEVLAQSGRLDVAREVLDRAIRIDPHDPQGYRVRALVARLQNRPGMAVADYDETIRRDRPDRPRVWDYFQRATPRWQLGQRTAALADLEQVRTRLGRSSFADLRRATILRELGRRPEANALLADIATTVGDAWLRGLARCLAGELSPVDLMGMVAPNDRERRCEGAYYAGEACLARRELDEARDWFEAVVATGLVFDPDALPLTLMNEYELARWRLATAFGEDPHAPISSWGKAGGKAP